MNQSILLVDDDVAITDNIAPILERAGFRVRVANNGKVALAEVEQSGCPPAAGCCC